MNLVKQWKHRDRKRIVWRSHLACESLCSRRASCAKRKTSTGQALNCDNHRPDPWRLHHATNHRSYSRSTGTAKQQRKASGAQCGSAAFILLLHADGAQTVALPGSSAVPSHLQVRHDYRFVRSSTSFLSKAFDVRLVLPPQLSRGYYPRGRC